jgi:hypothetical protein
VILTVQENPEIIIQENVRLSAFEKYSELFFDANTNPGKPNKKLTGAATAYKTLFNIESTN